jgi:hypothetical protein
LVPLTNAAHPGRPDCGCVTPNPQNRLQNPAFNGSLSGWVLDSGSGVFSHVPGSFQDEFGNFADATDCQSSGSARLDTPWDGSADSQRIWQCVSVSPNTTYNFGAKILGRGSYAYCDLDLYASGDCSGAPSNAASGLWLNVVWSPDQDAVVTTDGNTMSARVSCHIEGGGSAFFDMAYLTPWPGDF